MTTNNTTDPCTPKETPEINIVNFYIGLGLAIVSCFIMACSYIVKKLSLNRLMSAGKRAGEGGYGYLKDWMWWLGLLLMAMGEIINSVAYGFAPASLVTPLGALSVLITALLSAKVLQEHLNLIGKIGCAVCLCGSTIIVIHAPKEQVVDSIKELQSRVISVGFIIYFVITCVMNLILYLVVAPRFGKTNPIVYILISSSIGSISVMSVKGVGVCVKELLKGSWIWNYWIVYASMVVLVGGILIQVNFLNKALDLFNTNIVTPLIYVVFTVCVIVASTILLEEWAFLNFQDCLGLIVGFVLIILGFVLLYLFKEKDITWYKSKSDFLSTMYQNESRGSGSLLRPNTHSPSSLSANEPSNTYTGVLIGGLSNAITRPASRSAILPTTTTIHTQFSDSDLFVDEDNDDASVPFIRPQSPDC